MEHNFFLKQLQIVKDALMRHDSCYDFICHKSCDDFKKAKPSAKLHNTTKKNNYNHRRTTGSRSRAKVIY